MVYTQSTSQPKRIQDVIGDYVGPVVVKSSAGSIEGTVEGTTATGKIIDKYVDYQAELVKYGLGYNINTKLTATSEVTIDGETISKPITLQQNGSFTFDVGHENADSVVVKYIDAAGNSAEQVIFVGNEEPDDSTYIVPADEIESQLGDNKAKEVTISVPQFEEALNVEIDESLVKALKDSKKDLVIESKDLSFTLAKKVVEKLSKTTDETLTITLTREEATIQNAISDVYSFHFATGEDQTEINIEMKKST